VDFSSRKIHIHGSQEFVSENAVATVEPPAQPEETYFLLPAPYSLFPVVRYNLILDHEPLRSIQDRRGSLQLAHHGTDVRGLPLCAGVGWRGPAGTLGARLAMNEPPTHRVWLDRVIRIMYLTGLDMQSRYKETSLAGLALNVIAC